MEADIAAIWDELDDDMPCLARPECVRSVLGDEAADSLNEPLEFGDGEDD